MTDSEITIAVAKLDGWTFEPKEATSYSNSGFELKYQGELRGFMADHQPTRQLHTLFGIPPYFTSRDAIVPVIESYLRKGNYNNPKAIQEFNNVFGYPCEWQDIICATPRQLCIALLKATGNYKE